MNLINERGIKYYNRSVCNYRVLYNIRTVIRSVLYLDAGSFVTLHLLKYLDS